MTRKKLLYWLLIVVFGGIVLSLVAGIPIAFHNSAVNGVLYVAVFIVNLTLMFIHPTVAGTMFPYGTGFASYIASC